MKGGFSVGGGAGSRGGASLRLKTLSSRPVAYGLRRWLGVVLGLGKGAPVAGPRRGWAGSAKELCF